MYYKYFNIKDRLFQKETNLTFYAYLLSHSEIEKLNDGSYKPYITYREYKNIFNDLSSYFDCSTKTVTNNFKKLINQGLLIETIKNNEKVYEFPEAHRSDGEGFIAVDEDTLSEILYIDNKYALNIYLQLRKLKWYAKKKYNNPCPNFSIKKLCDNMGYSASSKTQIKKIGEAIQELNDRKIIGFIKVRVANNRTDNDITIPYYQLMDIKI